MKVIIFALLISLIACSKDSASTPATSQSADPFVGNWVRTYVVSGKPPRFEALSIKENGDFEARTEVTSPDGPRIVIDRGTYVKVGDQYRIVYTYGSCDNIDYEMIKVFVQADKLFISRNDSSPTIYEKSTAPALLGKKEVESCYGLTKITKHKRAIASEKK